MSQAPDEGRDTHERQTDRQRALNKRFFFLEFWGPWEPLDDYSSCRCRRSLVDICHRHDVSRTFVLVPTIVVVSRHVSVTKKLSVTTQRVYTF